MAMETPGKRQVGRGAGVNPGMTDFGTLIEPYRRELHVHCYRMLGSLQDAEDVLQETLLAAWRGLERFEERASLRTWLYSIATNRCLNARRSAQRRPAKAWDVPGVELLEPTRLGEVAWLEPCPEDLYERAEAISLAFITALQTMPPRQVAVLLLRDVLGFSAGEVAGMLTTTVDAVNSALKRARAAVPTPEPQPTDEAVVEAFARAWEAADVDALVELLTDDVFMSMPPMPFEYVGRELVGRFSAQLFAAGRRFTLVPTRANGQPAFGAYIGGAAVGLYVLTLRAGRISALARFEAELLPRFTSRSAAPTAGPAAHPR